MTIYVCEDCVDGIFTGVYNAWASRLGHANVALRVAGPADLELFAEYRNVETDAQKAQKVADTIRRRMGGNSYEMIYRAALANAPEKADCIYRVLTVGLSCRTDSRTASHLIEKLQDVNACRVFEFSRKVQNEAHRYEGFVRFRELDGGILFSEIEAENQVLPLIGEHFSNRFPNEHFLIFDHHSGDCLVHAARRQWFIWRGAGKELSVRLEDRSEPFGRMEKEGMSERPEDRSASFDRMKKEGMPERLEDQNEPFSRMEKRGMSERPGDQNEPFGRMKKEGMSKRPEDQNEPFGKMKKKGMSERPEDQREPFGRIGKGENWEAGDAEGGSRNVHEEEAKKESQKPGGAGKKPEKLPVGKAAEIKDSVVSGSALTTDEEEIQRLWRGFCSSISIQERENLHLQRQFWPLKFRKWMTEGVGQQE